MSGKVKNLGQISAIVYSHTEPENKRILWYDLSLEGSSEVPCPIKYYNQISSKWEFFVPFILNKSQLEQ